MRRGEQEKEIGQGESRSESDEEKGKTKVKSRVGPSGAEEKELWATRMIRLGSIDGTLQMNWSMPAK